MTEYRTRLTHDFVQLMHVAGVLFALVIAPTILSAQSTTRFTTGGRTIVALDFANTPLRDFPSTIEMVDGIMEVVSKNGRNMIRASSRSMLRLALPEVLPQDFVLEFDIVPKMSGNPEDLAIEGTPTINQGSSSANVLWHREGLSIVGGGATYDSRTPPSFAALLAGAPVQVVLAMQGETMKLYTNGRLMFTQSNRKFARTRVLRIFLGGQDDGPNAVHLASVRVVASTGPVGPVVAGGPPPGPNPTGATAGTPPLSSLPPSANPMPNVGGVSSPGTAAQPPASSPPILPVGQPGTTGGTSGNSANPPSAPANVVASPSGHGLALSWDEVPGATSYRVSRKETGTQQAGAVAPYLVELPPNATSARRSAIDPHVMPGVEMTYWVEAVAADGRTSAPSPVASATPTWFPASLPGPANLRVTVPGTQNLTQLNGAPGSLVTWTWDPSPSQYGYGVGLDLVRTNQVPQGIRDYVFTPPVSATNLSPRPATYTRAISQGVTALFCVFFWRTDDGRMIPAELAPPKPGLSCISAQVP